MHRCTCQIHYIIVHVQWNLSITDLRTKDTSVRVTTLKSEDMQNQSTLVFSVRSTLGKIETTPQIGEALEKLGEKRNIKS